MQALHLKQTRTAVIINLLSHGAFPVLAPCPVFPGSQHSFTLLSITSHSSLAFHKLTVLVYNSMSRPCAGWSSQRAGMHPPHQITYPEIHSVYHLIESAQFCVVNTGFQQFPISGTSRLAAFRWDTATVWLIGLTTWRVSRYKGYMLKMHFLFFVV